MRLKYMGTADIRDFLESDLLGGLLPEPLGTHIVFSEDNNWIIDTDDEAYADVDPEAWTILAETWPQEFKDISGFKRVPLNLNQKMFRGMKEGDQKTVEEEEAEAEERRQALQEELAAEVALSNAEVDDAAGLMGMKRGELNDLAVSVGVKNPESFANKAEVVTQIRKVRESASASSNDQATPTSPGAAGTGTTTVGGSTGGVGGSTSGGGGGRVGGSTGGTGS